MKEVVIFSWVFAGVICVYAYYVKHKKNQNN
jgi:hypothetical protein